MSKVKARFYTSRQGKFRCQVCPHHCLLGEGEESICGTRRVEKGVLYLLNYASCAAAAVDPIEKKPLYHFYPGSDVLSLGTWGCNFKCSFCQNWSLSQGEMRPGEEIPPEEVISSLKRSGPGCVGVAYTYNEPSIWFEYVYDTSRLVQEQGYTNVMVSNGYISREALAELLPYMDALNVDVKAFSESFYRDYCGGKLAPVMETVEECADKLHLEVTYLVVPGENDSREEITGLIDWLSGLSREIPLHFSRYFPANRFNTPPTTVEKLEEVKELAAKKLNYVYLGNVGPHPATHTYCPECGAVLVERGGFRVVTRGLENGKCCFCSKEINMVLTW